MKVSEGFLFGEKDDRRVYSTRCSNRYIHSNHTDGSGICRLGNAMFWYIKEERWYHTELHGPYDTKEEALQNKPKDRPNGRPEAQIFYKIFESEDLL